MNGCPVTIYLLLILVYHGAKRCGRNLHMAALAFPFALVDGCGSMICRSSGNYAKKTASSGRYKTVVGHETVIFYSDMHFI
jgi:hypothetical protein